MLGTTTAMSRLPMNFCSRCGASVSLRVPPGDNRERFVCDTCRTVHYSNPRIVAGSLAVWEDRVLLCQRAIEPRADYWTLPAGFLENNETIEAGAIRETWEEANAEIHDLSLYTVFSLPHISQVYLFYRARLARPSCSPGFESRAVALYREEEIPWDDLAFPVIRQTLTHYFADRRSGQFPVHTRDIIIDRDPANFR